MKLVYWHYYPVCDDLLASNVSAIKVIFIDNRGIQRLVYWHDYPASDENLLANNVSTTGHIHRQ